MKAEKYFQKAEKISYITIRYTLRLWAKHKQDSNHSNNHVKDECLNVKNEFWTAGFCIQRQVQAAQQPNLNNTKDDEEIWAKLIVSNKQ